MKVLIVDDVKENLYLLDRLLKKIGHEIVQAFNGEEALKALRQDSFDMIISDILMPVMDGFQLCRAVREDEKLQDILFVFCTATYTEKEDEKFALKLGADRFIRKPVEPEMFMEIIKNLSHDIEKCRDKPARKIVTEEKEIFKLYSERLIHKLEQKMLGLKEETYRRKQAEEALKEYSERLEQMVKERTNELESANEALEESRDFLQMVIDAIPEPTMVIDVEYSILLANRAIQEFAGEDPVSRSLKCHQVTHHSSHPCEGMDDPCPLDEAIRTKAPVTVVHTHYDREGNERIIEVQAAPIFDDAGEVIQIIEGGRDITERVRAEKALKKYRDHLEEMVEQRTKELRDVQEELVKREKLSVLGRLTAIVSHDLRNPLGVIRSSVYYLAKRLGDADEKSKKHLKRIEQQVGLCHSIVDELLEYTRGRRSEMLKGELNPWLERVLDEIETLQSVRLIRELSPNLPMVHFDQEKMRRVVINLVENALQAVIARQEGLKKEDVPYEPQVKVSTSITDNGVWVEVEDNGIGMDEETERRAFEVLFSTRVRGSGLGLDIVQKIVEEHGGSVSLDSEPGGGTKAIVVIPVDE